MKFRLWIFAVALALIAGCGGGGGGSSVGGPAGATVSTYATDSINDDFDHVWVTVYRVTAEGKSDAVLMEDPAGQLLDLKALRDPSGPLYALLDSRTVPSGQYSAVRVELDENLTLVPKGATTGRTHKFSPIHAGSPGRSVLKLVSPLNAQIGRADLVLDFDLATWVLDAADRVVATLKRGNGQGLDDRGRHRHREFHGTVSTLSGQAPNFTFFLSRGPISIQVRTDASTRIFNGNGSANPQLANGQSVEVSAKFVAGSLLASAVKIKDRSQAQDQKIKGLASNLNPATGTLDVAVQFARGFVPDRTVYGVTTSVATLYRSDAGAPMTKDEFFQALADLGAGARVEAEGVVNGGTFAAKKIKVEDERENPFEAEVKGSVTAIDKPAGTITISVTSWEGVNLSMGASIVVQASARTQFRLGRNFVDRTVFFDGLAVGGLIEAKGRLSGTTLSAILVKTED